MIPSRQAGDILAGIWPVRLMASSGRDSIAYPFNEACSIEQQYSSYVEAWIYDMARDRSTPVVIHLVCKG